MFDKSQRFFSGLKFCGGFLSAIGFILAHFFCSVYGQSKNVQKLFSVISDIGIFFGLFGHVYYNHFVSSRLIFHYCIIRNFFLLIYKIVKIWIIFALKDYTAATNWLIDIFSWSVSITALFAFF